MEREILFQIILFLSNTVQTITGFAGTLLAMPFSIRVIGVQDAKTVLNVFTMLACGIVAYQNRSRINFRILAKMIAGMLGGMVVGVWLFEYLPTEILLTIYAWLIIGIALKKMFWRKETSLPKWMTILILPAAGIIHGMFLSGGALLVVYAVSVMEDKDEFRATIAPVWVVLNAVLVFVHAGQKCYTPSVFRMILCSIVTLVLSYLLGNYLYKKISRIWFMRITYVLLLISGVSLLV